MYLDSSVFISLALLFGIAANFRAMDGYTFLRIMITATETRLGIVFAVAVVAAVFSPFVLNDVVVLILTPVLVRYARQFKVDVAPLVVAEVSFVNIASSLTPYGNPQNLLLWQTTGISAIGFVLGTWLPLLVSALLVSGALIIVTRGRHYPKDFPASLKVSLPLAYLVAVGVTIFALDTLGAPGVVAIALGFAFGFPFALKSPRRLAEEFDYRSLAILVVLIASVAFVAGAFEPLLAPYVSSAVAGNEPYSALFIGLTSNLISNVPATQLILGTVTVPALAAPRIAVEAGLAGNITPIGSLANILALLIVRRSGLPIKRTILLQLAVGIVSFLPAFL